MVMSALIMAILVLVKVVLVSLLAVMLVLLVGMNGSTCSNSDGNIGANHGSTGVG